MTPISTPIYEDRLFKKMKKAILALRAGKPIIVMDDEHRENEADIITPAVYATAEMVSFSANYGRGLICVGLDSSIVTRLQLNPMEDNNQDSFHTNFLQSVDLYTSTTGISAYERSATIQALANPHTKPQDLRRPGHVFPLGADPQGVLKRQGHTEAGVDLMRLASLPPVAMICEIVSEDGTMRRKEGVATFASMHGLPILSVQDIIQYRTIFHDKSYRLTKPVHIPTHHSWGNLKALGYESLYHDKEHALFVVGDPNDDNNLLLRIHSECLTGDVFGSIKCDCEEQLHKALNYMHNNGGGILIYLRQEGRNIGLFHKLQAYHLQEQGLDTVESNLSLGLPDDARSYDDALLMLQAYIKTIKHPVSAHSSKPSLRLITNNPNKIKALSHDYKVQPIALPTTVHEQNKNYLKTKKHKLHHILDTIK